MATVTTPVIASDQRTYDCQTDIRLSGITVDGTDVRSTVAVRVYADESYCGQLRRGAVYLLTAYCSKRDMDAYHYGCSWKENSR